MRFLDITDLPQWFASFKRVSGVQRVSIEAVRNIFGRAEWGGAWFDQYQRQWKMITATGMAAIRVSLEREEYSIFCYENLVSHSEQVRFSNAVLYSLGMNWVMSSCEQFYKFKQDGYGNKLVLYFHDLIPFTHPHLVDSAFVRHWCEFLGNAVSLADEICCSTPVTKRKMESLSRWGMPVPQVSVATYGLDHVRYSRAQAHEDLPAYIRDTERYLISFGTIDARKNQHALLGPWQSLKSAGSGGSCKLLLIGRVSDKRIDAYRGDKSILIVESANDAEMHALIAGASGVLLPTLAEGFCFPAFESLALGLTPTVTSLSEIRAVGQDSLEYFRSLDFGDIRDKMNDLLDANPKARPDPGEIACFKQYTWSEFIRSLEQISC